MSHGGSQRLQVNPWSVENLEHLWRLQRMIVISINKISSHWFFVEVKKFLKNLDSKELPVKHLFFSMSGLKTKICPWTWIQLPRASVEVCRLQGSSNIITFASLNYSWHIALILSKAHRASSRSCQISLILSDHLKHILNLHDVWTDLFKNCKKAIWEPSEERPQQPSWTSKTPLEDQLTMWWISACGLTSLRITQTGESVITERRMASRGPNVGSTSPSAIPFWNVPGSGRDQWNQ